jgi:hypothetical protein
MRNMQLGILFTLLTVTFALGGKAFGQSDGSPWSTYETRVSWKKERVFLENFATYLNEHPEMLGHVVYFSDSKFSKEKLEKKLERSVNFLVAENRISRPRLLLRYGGPSENSKIVLQPLPPKTDSSADLIPIRLVITVGTTIVSTYKESYRFEVKIDADLSVTKLLKEIRRVFPEREFENRYGDYFYLENPETNSVLDTRRSIQSYKLKDGSVLRLFTNIR